MDAKGTYRHTLPPMGNVHATAAARSHRSAYAHFPMWSLSMIVSRDCATATILRPLRPHSQRLGYVASALCSSGLQNDFVHVQQCSQTATSTSPTSSAVVYSYHGPKVQSQAMHRPSRCLSIIIRGLVGKEPGNCHPLSSLWPVNRAQTSHNHRSVSDCVDM